jgi:glutathione-specific gamma-glutamylcyclotransferase
MTDDLWIFGYGSIIWRVDFPYAEQRPAFIKNWCRRFWQGSTDHRGIPGKPGRVVTLVSNPGDSCWGRAYRLDRERQDEVLAGLDHREKGGYVRLLVDIYFDESDFIPGVTYQAASGNPNYLGDAAHTEIAMQITSSHGPSGSNTEYIYELHESLKQMNAADSHVDSVLHEVRLIEENMPGRLKEPR